MWKKPNVCTPLKICILFITQHISTQTVWNNDHDSHCQGPWSFDMNHYSVHCIWCEFCTSIDFLFICSEKCKSNKLVIQWWMIDLINLVVHILYSLFFPLSLSKIRVPNYEKLLSSYSHLLITWQLEQPSYVWLSYILCKLCEPTVWLWFTS